MGRDRVSQRRLHRRRHRRRVHAANYGALPHLQERFYSERSVPLHAPPAHVWFGSGQDRKFTYNFFERFGGYYGGTLNEFRVRANYRPTAKFSVSASETWDRFRLPLPNGNFSVVLASLQGNYSFNRFLTFTSLVQLDTSNAQAVSANLRLRYNYRPDSDLYIIYNVGTQFASIAPANPPQVRETRFAIKYTYSWQ